MTNNYSDLLKDPRWQKKRLEILNRDEFKCKICGNDKNTLHAHHINYIYDIKPWDYSENRIITLCDNCHKLVHINILMDVYDNGEISVYDLIQKYPFSLFCLKSIKNNHGIWLIDFQEKEGFFTDKIEMISNLCFFIKDNDSEVYVDWDYRLNNTEATNLFTFIKSVE